MNPLLLYKCDASYVDVHHAEGQTHLHSTAAGGPVHPGKSENVCLHVAFMQKGMKCVLLYISL